MEQTQEDNDETIREQFFAVEAADARQLLWRTLTTWGLIQTVDSAIPLLSDLLVLAERRGIPAQVTVERSPSAVRVEVREAQLLAFDEAPGAPLAVAGMLLGSFELSVNDLD